MIATETGGAKREKLSSEPIAKRRERFQCARATRETSKHETRVILVICLRRKRKIVCACYKKKKNFFKNYMKIVQRAERKMEKTVKESRLHFYSPSHFENWNDVTATGDAYTTEWEEIEEKKFYIRYACVCILYLLLLLLSSCIKLQMSWTRLNNTKKKNPPRAKSVRVYLASRNFWKIKIVYLSSMSTASLDHIRAMLQ